MTSIVDDILITETTEGEHDVPLTEVIERPKDNNTGPNAEKLQYKQKEVNFFGNTITEQGISPAEYKLQAIRDIHPPKIKEPHSFLGMIAYLDIQPN